LIQISPKTAKRNTENGRRTPTQPIKTKFEKLNFCSGARSYPKEFVKMAEKAKSTAEHHNITNPKRREVSRLKGKKNMHRTILVVRRQTTRQSEGLFFFVKIGFTPIKSDNSSRKSIKNIFSK
jgi:hypothetical protein